MGWSSVAYLVVILFPKVNVMKCGNKIRKDDLAESSALNLFSLVKQVALNCKGSLKKVQHMPVLNNGLKIKLEKSH